MNNLEEIIPKYSIINERGDKPSDADIFTLHEIEKMALELPMIKALIILDSEGDRIAAKYYSKDEFPNKTAQIEFERKIFKKTRSSQTRLDAEVAMMEGLTTVYKNGNDVTFFVSGGNDENELILVSVLDALFESISNLIKGNIDKKNLQNNLELVLLCLDEVVDGGIILEMDSNIISDRVMLRGAVDPAISSYKEMTVSQLLDKARDKAAKSFAK
jgi:Clathrin adaptor complex small chain